MEKEKLDIQFNIQISDLVVLLELITVSEELSISPGEFIMNSITKFLYDIKFVRNLRH